MQSTGLRTRPWPTIHVSDLWMMALALPPSKHASTNLSCTRRIAQRAHLRCRSTRGFVGWRPTLYHCFSRALASFGWAVASVRPRRSLTSTTSQTHQRRIDSDPLSSEDSSAGQLRSESSDPVAIEVWAITSIEGIDGIYERFEWVSAANI